MDADMSAPLRARALFSSKPSSHALCLLTLSTATIDVCTKRQIFETAAAVESVPINNA